YPSYPVSLTKDDLLKDVLKLHLATTGLNMIPSACPLAIHYKVIYRLVNTMYPVVKHGVSKGSSV
ncbi:hypothetical protein KI387_021470, partial [Taxus chinensis]